MPSAEGPADQGPSRWGATGKPHVAQRFRLCFFTGTHGPEQSLKRWDCSQQRGHEHTSAPLLTSIPDFNSNPGPGRAQYVYLILARTNKNILGSSINRGWE